MNEPVYGYAEGYYGKLLSWPERLMILDAMQRNGQNTYYYAPKEDALHRWQWRQSYSNQWRQDFSRFCKEAARRGITVVAGVAPGLDFDFSHVEAGPDHQALLKKCQQLKQDGADYLSLLMDDIDADFAERSGGFSSEGEAHAQLANSLSGMLGEALWVTPRIYANELAIEEPAYLPAFFSTLKEQHVVLYCGSDVVAHDADPNDIHAVTTTGGQRLILWDNLYANDYCPRRLYTGPWQGRDNAADVLLNPTGRVHTDCLLLDIMATDREPAIDERDRMRRWTKVLDRHGVPESFLELSRYFFHPVCNGQRYTSIPAATDDTFAALEDCLWRWKTPLSREWYGYLYGLKHDLLIAAGDYPELRLQKTQNDPLLKILRQQSH